MPALEAAVDEQIGTGDERAVVGREEERGVGDVRHLTAAAEGSTVTFAAAGRGDAAEVEVGWQRAGDHLRVPRSRAHRVHAYTEATELQRGGLGEPTQRELARGVRGGPGRDEEPVDGRDVDDRPTTAPTHRFDHRLDADERSELVDLEDPPNRLDRGVGDRGQMQNRGVVDEDVDVSGRLHE